MPKPYIFYVNGMSCTSCSNTVENALHQHYSDIDHIHIDLSTADPKKVTVIIKNTEEIQETIWQELKKEIKDVGFDCKEKEYQPVKKNEAKKTKTTLERAQDFLSSHWFLGITGATLGISLLIVFLMTSGLPLAVMIALASLSTLFTLILGANSFYDAWKKLIKARSLTMDSLFAISAITVLTVSIAAFFIPWLPMMFEAGLLLYGFRHIGLAIEETLKEKIHPGRFQDRAPQKVRLIVGKDSYEVSLGGIKANNIISIYPGEIIPLDGLCEEDSQIYNTIITGLTLPQNYRKGEKVLAGMRLAEDAKPLQLRVTQTAKKSYLARIDTAIENSLLEKAPLELKTQKLLNYFIPAVIALALLSGIGLSLFFPVALAIKSALSVLVSACPCTLGLIIPLTVKTGMHKAAEHGVYFKNAKTLQEAEQIDTVMFDLNGTLTEGFPSVKHFEIFHSSKIHLHEFFSLCASLEQHAQHPFAKAIYSYAQKHKPQILAIQANNKTHHAGIQGIIDGIDYAIGSAELMQELTIDTATIRHHNKTLNAGDNVVYLARDKELLGYIVLTDALRQEATTIINHLKNLGKEIYLCTGSDEETAERYAKILGIEHIYANCQATALNEQDRAKPTLIKNLQKRNKKVAMVGDAANDAHALAVSDLGVAILSQNSDELTQQNAGVVIQNNSLAPLAYLFELSKQTVNTINQNLFISIGYNLSTPFLSNVLFSAIGLSISPAIGAALMIFQAVIVLGNVYRFKKSELDNFKEKLKPNWEQSSFKKMLEYSNLCSKESVKKLDLFDNPNHYSCLLNTKELEDQKEAIKTLTLNLI